MLEHDFEITGDPKGSLSGSTFGPRRIGVPVGPCPFLGPNESKMANKTQNRDFLTPIDR